VNRRDAVVALVALGAATGSRVGRAQQRGKVWRVGYLSLGSASGNLETSGAFLKGMRDLGYVEGTNLIVEWRFADGNFDRLPGLAADLVRLKVDVIVAVASGAIGAAQKATTTIPIVMATTGDPVGSGFVKSLARPGGNITGLSNMGGDTGGKLVEWLVAALPRLSRVGVLVTPTSPTYRAILESVQGAAQKAGIKTVVVEASNPQDIENAFATMASERVGAVVVGSSPLFGVQRKQIADLALKYRLPSMFGSRIDVEVGGFMAFGGVRGENYLRSATYVDKILKGAKPGDLPVEQPTQFELVVNLNTAKALGVTVPQAVLTRAEVIQ